MLIYFPRLLREHTCIHAYTAKSKRQGGWVHDTLIIIFTLPTHPRDIHRRTRSEARALPYLTPMLLAENTCKQHAMQHARTYAGPPVKSIFCQRSGVGAAPLVRPRVCGVEQMCR
jgi:hypothetical protein